MKLHKISLSNLNSLYGEHEVDLQNDLRHAPLFLIIGQTGSGKSTILDAICLALFGQTPRLPKIPGKSDTAPGLIMSHGTGDCYAKVEFSKRESDGARRTYRAEWSCRRSRGRPNGNLQSPERSLTLIHDGGIEELIISDHRIKKLLPDFNRILEGLSVDDFQRSVLLAQGQFAAFLKASESEKASILERLTNTDKYKRIGQRASHRYKAVNKEYEQLQQQHDGLTLLSSEEETELRNEFSRQLDLIKQVSEQQEATDSVVKWLQEKQKLQHALEQVEAKQAEQQEEWSNHQEDIERLQAHERCQPAEAPLHDVRKLEKELQTLEKDAPEITAQCEEAEKIFQGYVASFQAAEEMMISAQQSMVNARPTLDEAHKRAGILEKNHAQLASIQKDAKKETADLKKKKKIADQAEKEFSSSQASVTMAQAALEEVEHLSRLGEVVLVLETETERILEQRVAIEKTTKKQSVAKKKIEDLDLKQNKLQVEQAALKASFAPQEKTFQHAAEALASILVGVEDIREFRAGKQTQREALQALQRAVEEAIPLHDALIEILQKIKAEKESEKEKQKELKEKQTEQEQLDVLHQQTISLQEEQAAHLQVLERILTLPDIRPTLEDGKPCPLCGSEEHPYHKELDEAEAGLDEVEAQFAAERKALLTRIKQTKKESTALQKQRSQLDKDIVRLEESIAQHCKTKESLEVSWQQTEQSWIDALTRASCDIPDAFPKAVKKQKALAKQHQQKQQEYQDAVVEVEALLAKLDEAEKAVEEAEASLKQAREQESKMAVEAAKLEEKLQLQQANFQEGELALAEQQERQQQQAESLKERFTQAGIEVPETSNCSNPFDFAVAVETAKAKKESFVQAQQQYLAAQEGLKSSKEKHEEGSKACDEIQRILDHLKEQREALEEETAALENEQEELLKGEALEALQERLEQAVEEAKQAQEEQRKGRDSAQEKHHRLQAEWNERQRTLGSRRDALQEATQTLQEAMDALDIKTQDELEECLLPAKEYQQLHKSLDSLKRSMEQMVLQIDTMQANLEEHLLHRPSLEDMDERSLEEWTEQAERYKKKVTEEAEKIGVLRQRIEQMEQTQKKASGIRDKIDEATTIRNIWKSINDLIGVRDGDAFKLFAQSLNLQELVVRANDRLRRLAPRYRLAVAKGDSGEPLLNFVIKDFEQAEDERPITTLSGGETFLVSLALALALADFRRIDMPIETLLLDEGFGTLDQDTLDVVMQTLRQLQQETDQQIALISHVEALKERIDAQVIVEKIGNGRSKIRVSAPTMKSVAT